MSDPVFYTGGYVVEGLCAPFYARMGRPGLAPGRYFRLLLNRVLRRTGLRASHRVADGGLTEPAVVPALGAARVAA